MIFEVISIVFISLKWVCELLKKTLKTPSLTVSKGQNEHDISCPPVQYSQRFHTIGFQLATFVLMTIQKRKYPCWSYTKIAHNWDWSEDAA